MKADERDLIINEYAADLVKKFSLSKEDSQDIAYCIFSRGYALGVMKIVEGMERGKLA